MARRLLDFNSPLPLGTIEIEPVGWDCRHFLRLGRAAWIFKREGFSLSAVYRNLEQERDWPLGTLSPATSDADILCWIAAQTDSHSPSDWVSIDGRILSFTPERGMA